MFKRKYILPFLWFAFITTVSLRSGKRMPDIMIFPHFDKVAHFGVYAIFSVLLIPAFVKAKQYKHAFLYALFISAVCGLTFELLQLYSFNRSAEVADMLANLAGVLAGIVFYNFLIKGKKLESTIFKIG